VATASEALPLRLARLRRLGAETSFAVLGDLAEAVASGLEAGEARSQLPILFLEAADLAARLASAAVPCLTADGCRPPPPAAVDIILAGEIVETVKFAVSDGSLVTIGDWTGLYWRLPSGSRGRVLILDVLVGHSSPEVDRLFEAAALSSWPGEDQTWVAGLAAARGTLLPARPQGDGDGGG
jgi:hypothetical protein